MNRRHHSLLATGTVAAAHFANDALTSMFPALLPLLVGRLELAGAFAAALVALFSVSTSLPQPLMGSIADRIGAQRAVAIGLLVSALLITFLPHAGSGPMLLALLVLGGLGSAMVHPAGVALAGRVAGDDRATAMGVFAAGGMMGAAAGPVIALGIAASAGASALGWLLIPATVMAFAVSRVTSASAVRASVVPVHAPKSSIVSPEIMQLTFVGVLAALPFMILVNSLPLWLVEMHSIAADSPVIGYSLATFSAAAAAGGIIAGIAARTFSRVAVIAVSFVIAVPTLLGLLAFTPGSIGFFTVLALAGATLYAHMPLLIATAQDLLPGRESAAGGMIIGGTWAGAGILYIGFGWLQDHTSFSQTLAFAAFGLLPAASIAWRALAPRKAKSSWISSPMPCPCAA